MLTGMAEARRSLGPFRPGDGRLPPHLAGRETEQELLLALVAELEDRVPPPGEVILYGPRGNGKTTLLVWLERHLEANAAVEVARFTPSIVRSSAELAERLLPTSWWEALTPEEVSVAGLEWRPGSGDTPPAYDVLRARASRKPLVVLLDEAHTLSVEVGRELLNASQQVAAKWPLLVVLAGTPDLRDRLSRMGASFWSRARQLPINRLDPVSSASAVERPLRSDGVGVAAAALEEIVGQSHGHPYFLQIWGSLVWRRARSSGRSSVAVPDVEAVRPAFERERGLYYLARYEELEANDLLPVARAVADAFGDGAMLSASALDDIVRGVFGDGQAADIVAATRRLRHLGFIWRPGPTPEWEPGIPSLMDYIRAHTRAS